MANDGRPGENDDVQAVERIDTGYQPSHPAPGARYTGSDAAETFNLIFTNGTVSAGGGDDVVTGSDLVDTLDGGAGADQISGGFGDDVITGGPGQDDIGEDRTAACFYGPIYGTCTVGSGNDTIYAQDGEKDTIDCGPGTDTAHVDAIDVVTGCETLDVTGATAAPPPPTTTTPTASAPGPTTVPAVQRAPARAAAPVLTVPRQSLRLVVRRRAVIVRCRLQAAGRCTVQALVGTRDARRLGRHVRRGARTVTLTRRIVTLKRAGAVSLSLRLSRKTSARLWRLRALRITLVSTATYASGHRSARRSITLRR